MSKPKNQNNQEKKILPEHFLAIAGLIISAFALFFSWQANQIARESNKITEEQQQPKVSIIHQFTYQRYADAYKDPCISSFGVSWDTEFAVTFDINNTGGAPLSLIKVDFPEQLDITTPISGSKVYASLSYFSNRDELLKWYNEKDGPSETAFFPMIEQSVATGTPIKVDAYTTVRLILHGTERVSFDPAISAQETHDLSRNGAAWTTSTDFIFSDGTKQSVSFFVARPYAYYWEPTHAQFPNFPACK